MILFNKSSPRLPYILAVILLLFAAGVVVYTQFPQISGKILDLAKKNNVGKTVQLKPEEQNKQGLADLQAGKFLSYTHPALGFTFQYPESYSVGNFPDGEDGETVIVQKYGSGFQIYIRPFDEDTVLTAERIKKDIPNLTVDEPTEINMDDALGVAFVSKNDAGQATREAWLVHDKHLYQISAPKELEQMLMEILQSWKWN